MFARVASFCREQGLLEAGDRVVAGVSGGADSVCLLHVLVRLRAELGLTVHAVHVHHGLRGAEADRDAAFVKKLAAEWDVPCRVVYADVRGYAGAEGLTEEEAGRILRYRALRDEAERMSGESPDRAGNPTAGVSTGAERLTMGNPEDAGTEPAVGCPETARVKIAVGHQKEDQAETILHHLFRGSALKGLAGMAALSDIRYDGLPSRVGFALIRPLLCVSRGEIRDYLARHHLSCCEDSTNDTADYTRNRIRQLLPLICRDVNERAVDHILAAGERIAQADAYLEGEAARIWSESGVIQRGRCGIPAAVLGGAPEILAGYLARKMIALQSGSLKDITAVHAEQIRGLADRRTGKSVSLPGGLCAVREYEMIWVQQENFPAAEEAGVPGRSAARGITFSRFPYEKNGKIPENQYTKWFDYDRITDTLSVRTRQPGDYITIKGGHRKSVKSYMIDEKIPRRERDRILLLAEGSHVLWIVGYRISEYYKVTEDTKEILRAQVRGGEEYGGEDTGTDSGRGCE